MIAEVLYVASMAFVMTAYLCALFGLGSMLLGYLNSDDSENNDE